MHRFVIGDIHGGYKALIQCLERSQFDYNNDLLICLGDVCDGWPDTKEAVDRLLTIKNLVFILGNHDFWTLEYAQTGSANSTWLQCGGDNTLKSYNNKIPLRHQELFEAAKLYYILENKLFVHAGIEIGISIEKQGADTFLWDRSLFREAIAQFDAGISESLTPYEETYIGHSPIHRMGYKQPILSGDVWLMDTGAGWEGGVLSMMNIDSKDIYISDRLDSLYPAGAGRQRF
ncbi:MAG: metallophosphoesterase [Bacteroidota bacterium]